MSNDWFRTPPASNGLSMATTRFQHVTELYVQEWFPEVGYYQGPGTGYMVPVNESVVHIEPIERDGKHGYRFLLSVRLHYYNDGFGNVYCDCAY